MIDFLLGVALVVVLYRGYRRGFIREATGFALLVVGAVVAFRTGTATGAFFESWTGASPLIARMMGGFTVFFLIQGLGSFLIARFVHMAGPARLVDRMAGMALAGLWFVVGATMLMLVASAVPFSGTLGEQIEDSRAVELVAGDESALKRGFSALVGDRVLEALVNLNQLIGDQHVVIEGAETVQIPESANGLSDAKDAAREVFDLLNLARIDAGSDPLAWSAALADVGLAHGLEMYEEGYFSHVSPATGTVADRVGAVGIPYRLVGENLALSPTPESVHEGLFDSPSHRANMLDDRFTRVGVAAVEGPLGLMVVQVFTG